MRKVGQCSVLFDNVYLNESATVVGPKEYMGPLKYYYDKYYNSLDCNEDSWEKAEMRLQQDAIELVMEKLSLNDEDISFIISGDLNNQIAVSSYVMRNYDICHIGMYGACTTSVLSLLNGSVFVDSNIGKYVGCLTSSHNATSERQFRFPTEYGGQKPQSLTSTVTGAGIGIISNNKSEIKITGGTFGKVVDVNLKDPLDLGRTMAPAAAMVFLQHLKDFRIDPSYYDLILTGDLGALGSRLLKHLTSERGFSIEKNHVDCGEIIYIFTVGYKLVERSFIGLNGNYFTV